MEHRHARAAVHITGQPPTAHRRQRLHDYRIEWVAAGYDNPCVVDLGPVLPEAAR